MNATKKLTAILMVFVATMAVGVPIVIGGDVKMSVKVGYGDIEVESVCADPNTVTLYPCPATTPITVSATVYHPNGRDSIVGVEVSSIASDGVDFSGFTGIEMTEQGGASICRATYTTTVDLPCDLSPGDWTVEVKVEDKEKYKCDTTSFSIAPPDATNVSDALKGREYEHIITVFNTLDEDADFELNAIGPGSEWITFYRVEDPETPITAIHIKALYLFRWDNVPGCDSEGLLRFLMDEFYIGWSVNAEIQKADDCISIVKDDDSAEIKLDEQNGNAILTINDGRTLDLSARDKNGVLTPYRWHSEQQILVKINVPADAPSMVYKPTIKIKGIPFCDGGKWRSI